MSGFDIESLLEFRPARRWCLNCLALWENFAWESWNDPYSIWDDSFTEKKDYKAFFMSEDRRFIKCKVCAVNYVDTDRHTIYRINDFIDECIGLPLKNIDNIVEHAKRLAFIGRKMRTQKEEYPPMMALLTALMEARSFVHFVSYGMTQMMIGMLKMIAQRVSVRGIVANPGENILCEVDEFKDEAPNLEIKFCASKGFRSIDIPHQKLIVIDELLAFKGSANFTQMSWRSAAKGMEIIDAVSNIDEIVGLHNQFFAPIWGKMSDDEHNNNKNIHWDEEDRKRFFSKFPGLTGNRVINLWD